MYQNIPMTKIIPRFLFFLSLQPRSPPIKEHNDIYKGMIKYTTASNLWINYIGKRFYFIVESCQVRIWIAFIPLIQMPSSAWTFATGL